MEGSPKLVATLLYGAGLRLMECLRLRLKDFDFTNNAIPVRDGKGQKDRITTLPASVKVALIAHLRGVWGDCINVICVKASAALRCRMRR